MGQAMVQGWLQKPDVTCVDIIEPYQTNLPVDARLHFFADAQSWAEQKNNVDIVVLAVKPQVIDSVNLVLPAFVPQDVPVLSIAAGITLTNLTKAWGVARPLIRAMPNTPGAIGQGVTGYIINKNIIEEHDVIANSLLSALGHVYQVTDEKQMDAITAVSGSGPAYVYNFVEALENAAKNIGLPNDLARDLARQTVIGAAALLAHETTLSPEALRVAVTSPGGTTEAALNVLMGNQGLATPLSEAVKAAFKRSQELAQS